jgi:uncharacterized protein
MGVQQSQRERTEEGQLPMLSRADYGLRTEKVTIPARDGVGLAATLYMPDVSSAVGERFPVLLELLPYRKDDGTVLRDQPRYEYFARRGYVGARVDVRGTGASAGVAEDQYSAQEGQDALDVMAWLTGQPWCNGSIGMWGISYGGFNSIQVAMLRPPTLKAIIAVDATDDVYTDDVMYWQGALQCETLGRYPFLILVHNLMPPYPDYDVDSQVARDRFENPHEPWLLTWLRQQRDGAYWRRTSLRPRYDAVQVPTLMIGGWLDGYTDSIPRMAEHMSAPTRAIIGPWPHAWPESASPGPRIDGMHEALRWWDHWLKGKDTGLMNEPRLALYVPHYYPPRLDVENIPGEWRFEDAWPVVDTEQTCWFPQADGGLAASAPATEKVWELEYKATVGSSNRYRVPHYAAELFTDQRADDAYSLSFTSAPLEEPLEILGFPQAVLFAEASAPLANWIVRLSDIAPNSSSQLVSKGILNGSHRKSHTNPEPLEPGEVYELTVSLKVTSWVFPKGHRIRISVCNADFPNLWPTPYAMTTKLHVTQARPSRITLPVSSSKPQPNFRRPSEIAANAKAPDIPADVWQVTRDETNQTLSVFREWRRAADLPGHDGNEAAATTSEVHTLVCTASDLQPAFTKVVAQATQTVKHGADVVEASATLTVQSNETQLHFVVERKVARNGVAVRGDSREEVIPRDHI